MIKYFNHRLHRLSVVLQGCSHNSCKLCKLWVLLVALLSAGCDSGDIEEKTYAVSDTGYVVKLTVRISGTEALDRKYTLALAGFVSGDNYAKVQQSLPTDIGEGETVSLVMSNVSEQVSTVEFVVTNRRRERIVTLRSISLADYDVNAKDTIRLDLGTVDLSPFGCLQQGVFNVACIQCHGGNGRSAASLNLTAGQALSQLVDVPSTRKEGMFRVVSGDAQQSLLHQILAEGGEEILHYNHTEVASSQFKDNLSALRSFIDDWINGLAPPAVSIFVP